MKEIINNKHKIKADNYLNNKYKNQSQIVKLFYKIVEDITEKSKHYNLIIENII